jgi:hypothetical protein
MLGWGKIYRQFLLFFLARIGEKFAGNFCHSVTPGENPVCHCWDTRKGMLVRGINKMSGKGICENGGKEIRLQNMQKNGKRRVREPFNHKRNYHLCGLVVRVPGYRSRDPWFDSWRYQIF